MDEIRILRERLDKAGACTRDDERKTRWFFVFLVIGTVSFLVLNRNPPPFYKKEEEDPLFQRF